MADLTTEWARITRFIESGRIALARERSLWSGLEIVDPQAVVLSVPADRGEYSVGLQDHLAAINDEEMLLASGLIQSYAISEWAAADKLGVDPKQFGGIEDWGLQVLRSAGHDWSGVVGELQGAVELAVIRNAFTHGTRTIDGASAARLQDAGAPPRAVGDPVRLSYPELREYRLRLQSLLANSDLG